MSFAEAQYTVDSLLAKLKTGEVSGLPPLPALLGSASTIGVNWENQKTTQILMTNDNNVYMVNFPHEKDNDIFKDTIVSGKKLVTLGGSEES